MTDYSNQSQKLIRKIAQPGLDDEQLRNICDQITVGGAQGTILLDTMGEDGMTALDYAAFNGYRDVVTHICQELMQDEDLKEKDLERILHSAYDFADAADDMKHLNSEIADMINTAPGKDYSGIKEIIGGTIKNRFGTQRADRDPFGMDQEPKPAAKPQSKTSLTNRLNHEVKKPNETLSITIYKLQLIDAIGKFNPGDDDIALAARCAELLKQGADVLVTEHPSGMSAMDHAAKKNIVPVLIVLNKAFAESAAATTKSGLTYLLRAQSYAKNSPDARRVISDFLNQHSQRSATASVSKASPG